MWCMWDYSSIAPESATNPCNVIYNDIQTLSRSRHLTKWLDQSKLYLGGSLEGTTSMKQSKAIISNTNSLVGDSSSVWMLVI